MDTADAESYLASHRHYPRGMEAMSQETLVARSRRAFSGIIESKPLE